MFVLYLCSERVTSIGKWWKWVACISYFPLPIWSLLDSFCAFWYLSKSSSLIALSSLLDSCFIFGRKLSLDLWFGLAVCFVTCCLRFELYAILTILNCAFFKLVHSILANKLVPLCEPGEIPWFAERVNWSQSVALNDDCNLSFIILSSIWLFLFFCRWKMEHRSEAKNEEIRDLGNV